MNHDETIKTPHWLIARTHVHGENIWYNAYINGKEYSVMNVGELVEDDKLDIFMGWEAIEIVDGRLDVDAITRADTHEELYKMLTDS